MFHLYFGGFDVLLYLGGIYGAIALSKALCDQMDAADIAQSSTTTTALAPMQPLAPELIAPAAKREEVSVRVSV
ncbi:hypothetical protein C8255_10990 [filamentous cyanobacterium CCP3]|nr:hypothetical protein C8255_10990 [filamentous cyanobacterium CCP3]